jgi:hypothetical protein
MSAHVTQEIYVRFVSDEYGSGIFETPAASIEEAAGQFCEDADSVSAMRVDLNADGRALSVCDVTRDVVQHLEAMIRDGAFTEAPHPLLEEAFSTWEEEDRCDAQEQADHIRDESMPSLYL